MHEARSSEPLSGDPSTTAIASQPGVDSEGSAFPGGEIDSKLDLAARSRMASLRSSMFGASAEPARVGRFVVLETLGAGGMGVVHAAYDPRLDRKIALKLVKPEVAAAGTNGEARLLREAQAMARLSHPNVVQIHEVGAWDGRVFIAMELVAGRSLATWLEVQPRGWREVVHMFAEAGRGLAAAHAAGMVHRDFKPENVLVGDDGRVRVTDFGLARGGTGGSEAGETWREPGDPLAAIVEGMSVGTAAFAGTPRFMSPEQFLGEPATAASDQFSFCVALYVALHGVHPFAGEDRATLAKAVIAGERREPPRMRVPRKIHKAVVKGLARTPEGRFAGMGELLRAIEPRAGWQRMMPVALFGLTSGTLLSLNLDMTDPCAVEPLLVGVWDHDRRATIQRAYEASEVPDAELVWASTTAGVDDYVKTWGEAYHRSCEAQRRGGTVRGIPDLWGECLVRKLEVLRSLTRTLAAGDVAALRGGPEATAGLDDIAACADGRALVRGMESVPSAQRPALAELQAGLADARSHELLGALDRGTARIERLVREARQLGHEPTLAEALYQRGRLAVLARDFIGARKDLDEALWLAVGSHNDLIVAEMWGWLIHAVVVGESNVGHTEEWLRQADAWMRRGSGGPLPRARLDVSRALVMSYRGDHQGAEIALRSALAVEEMELGADHISVASVRMNLANAVADLGRTEEAIAEHRRALAAMVAKVGARHPMSADFQYNLGVALLDDESPEALDEAQWHIETASEIIRAAAGPDSMELADCYLARAKVAYLRDDHDAAQAGVEEALRIYGRHPGHADRAHALTFAGALHYADGRLEESLAAHSEVRAIWLAARGRASELVGAADGNIAMVLLAQGDLDAATRRFDVAVGTLDAALGPGSDLLQEPLIGLGQALMEQSRDCEARAPLLRAVALMRARSAVPVEVDTVEEMSRRAAERCV